MKYFGAEVTVYYFSTGTENPFIIAHNLRKVHKINQTVGSLYKHKDAGRTHRFNTLFYSNSYNQHYTMLRMNNTSDNIVVQLKTPCYVVWI